MTLGSNIRLHRLARGLTLEQLSTASGVEVGTISALEMRASSRSKYAPALARALGLTLDVLYRSPPTQQGGGAADNLLQAQELSLSSLSMLPQIKWEQLVSIELPKRFEVNVPDDSMAPRVRAGQPVTLSTDEEPRPGDGILVVDAQGNHYLRQYVQRTSTSWEAVALNSGYATLDAQRDGLRVVAVLVGVPARWG